jgi:hypothetical protein
MGKKEKLSIKAIEQKIIASNSETFIINQNYEIIVPSTGKGLFSCQYFCVDAINKLFDHLYKDNERFSLGNIEVHSRIFTDRLNALHLFLKKTGKDVFPVACILSNVRYIEGDMKIDALTKRIFDDFRNPVFSKGLMRGEVYSVLHKFCQQWHVEKQELLFLIEQIA